MKETTNHQNECELPSDLSQDGRTQTPQTTEKTTNHQTTTTTQIGSLTNAPDRTNIGLPLAPNEL